MKLQYDSLEPGLALSHHPGDATALQSCEFQAILNVCDFGEPSYASAAGPDIRIIRYPFEDCWPVPFPWLLGATLELADLRRRDVPTLVHCHAGRSRSPTVVALYWMARDRIDWRTAVTRLRRYRPDIDLDPDGGSRLLSHLTRDRAVELIQAFLQGDTNLLQHFRDRAQDFTRVCERRLADLAPREADWNLIDDGLAIGQSLAPWPVLAREGFDRILITQAYPDSPTGASLPAEVPTEVYTFPEQETVEMTVLRGAVQQLDQWRRQGHRVFVIGPDQDFFAVTTACVWLMRSRCWDAASALWYLGSRRQRICFYLEILMEAGLEELAMGCAADAFDGSP
jgi:protein-tyrosine phosphatase